MHEEHLADDPNSSDGESDAGGGSRGGEDGGGMHHRMDHMGGDDGGGDADVKRKRRLELNRKVSGSVCGCGWMGGWVRGCVGVWIQSYTLVMKRSARLRGSYAQATKPVSVYLNSNSFGSAPDCSHVWEKTC